MDETLKEYLRNIFYGFIIGSLPFLATVAVVSLTSGHLDRQLAILDPIEFGAFGIILSIFLTYFFRRAPKVTKWVIWVIIAAYLVYHSIVLVFMYEQFSLISLQT